jgi:hypothetical protein
VLRLSSHQATLLLSSIWAQAISPKNTPQNYEAIAHTYSLLLLFLGSKVLLFMSCHLFNVYSYLSFGENCYFPANSFVSLFFFVKMMILYSMMLHHSHTVYCLLFVFGSIVYNVVLHTFNTILIPFIVYSFGMVICHHSEHHFSVLFPPFSSRYRFLRLLLPVFRLHFLY